MNPVYKWDYDWLSSSQSKKINISSSKFCYYSTNQKEGYNRVKLYVRKRQRVQEISMFYSIKNIDNLDTDHFYPQQQKAIEFTTEDKIQTVQKQVQMSSQLIIQSSWVNKYKAKRYVDLLSQQAHNRLVLTWAKNWDKIVFKDKAVANQNRKSINMMMKVEQETDPFKKDIDSNRLILLSGPPGCGKTTLARVVAHHCGYKHIEINASDTRSAKQLIRRIDDMANIQSISDKPTFIIIDQVDGILDNQTNGISQILNYIQSGQIPGDKSKKDKKKQKQKHKASSLYTKRPIIFICNDPFVKGLKQLRKKCYTVYMQKIRIQSIVDKLKSICEVQNVSIERQALLKIADLNSNDIRGSLAMLEFITHHKQFGRISTTKILNSIEWDIKDSSKSPVDFVEKLMLLSQVKKYNDFQLLTSKLCDIESGPSLVLQTLFNNLKNSKPVQRYTTKVPQLLEVIAQADISIHTSFGNQGTMGHIFALPYYYYKLQFKPEDNQTRVQFPIAYFEWISKKRQQIKRLNTLWEGLHNSIKIYYSPKSVKDILRTLYVSIQSFRTHQKELIKCLKIMVSHGIKFDEHQNQLFYPPLQSMIGAGRNQPPKRILSNVGKTLMKSNYNNIRQSLDNIKYDIKPTQWKLTLNSKKSKRDGIEYKFKQGTGTQVKDLIKMNYFM